VHTKTAVTAGIFFALLLFLAETLISVIPQAAAQHHGAPPPPASLGDRKVSLNFDSNPKVINPSQPVNIKINFEDLGKHQNVQQVTFRMDISKDGKTIFSDFFYGPTGEVNLQFRPSNSSPTVNGNDNGLGAWTADPGSPIVVNGKVFSDPGIYKTVVEVTGIDNIKTDLPQPLDYDFNTLVFVNQSFAAKYKDMNFDINTVSPMQLAGVTFLQAKKQLVLNTTDMIDAGNHDFSMRVGLPKEMMSGPFTATLDDGTDLVVTDNGTDSSISNLIITSSQHGANMTMNEGGVQNRPRSLVISATNVVPEFPLGVASVAAAITILGVTLTIRKKMEARGEFSSMQL
jgi:hypothetical protein